MPSTSNAGDVAAIETDSVGDGGSDRSSGETTRPRLLVLQPSDVDIEERAGRPSLLGESLRETIGERFEVVRPATLAEGLQELRSAEIAGVCVTQTAPPEPVASSAISQAALSGLLLECGGLLEWVPDGYCLVDLDERVLWSNAAFRTAIAAVGSSQLATLSDAAVLPMFDDLFGDFQFVDHHTSALSESIGTGQTARSTISVGSEGSVASRFYEVQATPLCEFPSAGGALPSIQPECAPSDMGIAAAETLPSYLLVSIRDVTETTTQRQKLAAIDEAGLVLSDLAPGDILEMKVEERIEFLKSKIVHYIEDLLQYETVEIRLLDEETRSLAPLLSIGMTDEAASRPLKAAKDGYGVTGYVAATGNSYRCDHTRSDPLYLKGGEDARSSLTVPLIQHDDIIGTFNVESRDSFSDGDLKLLERFSGEVAAALNTLELLAIEQTATASSSVEKILCDISTPLDEILTNAAYVLEQYIGHDQPVADRLRQIVQDARDIRRGIQEIGQAPCAASFSTIKRPDAPPEASQLAGKRVLVVDEDPSVRIAAHSLLGKYGCNVETSLNGEEAAVMVRTFHYDAVLMDIRPADMTGSECFRRLREIREHLPLIIMTGYGYDPMHTIVKCREMGLQATLFKPFRRDQLLTVVGTAVSDLNVASAAS